MARFHKLVLSSQAFGCYYNNLHRLDTSVGESIWLIGMSILISILACQIFKQAHMFCYLLEYRLEANMTQLLLGVADVTLAVVQICIAPETVALYAVSYHHRRAFVDFYVRSILPVMWNID